MSRVSEYLRHNTSGAISRAFDKPKRNDLCLCGSGKKFKKCCISKFEYQQDIKQEDIKVKEDD